MDKTSKDEAWELSRRVIACVNALSGVPTETLEALARPEGRGLRVAVLIFGPDEAKPELLYVARNEGETWRECVARYAAPYGVADAALDDFDFANEVHYNPDTGAVDQRKRSEADEAEAAWETLAEWGLLGAQAA